MDLITQVVQILESAPAWIIFSHMKLDGDAVGAAAALFETGILLDKQVRWFGPDPLPPSFAFLPHTDEYVAQKEYRFDGEEGIYIFLDSSNEDRGVLGLRERLSGAVTLNIDHHEDNTRFGTLNCVDPEMSSAAELLWHIMTFAGWPITGKVAECLYTGIITDTGGFMFNNTTARTHHVAADLLTRGVVPPRIDALINQTRSIEGMHLWGVALGRVTCWGSEAQFAMTWLSHEDFKLTRAIVADTDSLVNQLLLLRGVRFAVLIVEEEGKEETKASFRSKEGMLTAASVARSLGGGGHPRASGATIAMPLEKAILLIRETVENAYGRWTSADR